MIFKITFHFLKNLGCLCFGQWYMDSCNSSTVVGYGNLVGFVDNFFTVSNIRFLYF